MDTEAYVGLISAALALLGALLSGLLASRANKQAHELDRRRRMDTQLEAAERILNQYRDPLLDAAQTLQSRFYNIIDNSYLANYLNCGDPDEERYARDYTLYAIAEYLCWVEIVRRELRFLDLGDVTRNRQLLAHLTKTQVTFQSNKIVSPFQIFRGKQRAIAELMMVPTNAPEGPRNECMGYAMFCHRLDHDPQFATWFERLRTEDVDTAATGSAVDNVRLSRLQSDLIDLIDFLDPTSVRITPDYRARLAQPDPDAVAATRAATDGRLVVPRTRTPLEAR